MYKNIKYKIIVFLCILFLGIMICENYKVEKSITEKQNKLQLMEEKTNGKYVSIKKFGYSDIIKVLGEQEGLKITKFMQSNEKNVTAVETYIIGDIYTTEKVLKSIEGKENFRNINNIKMEKDKDDQIITILNMNFIKNK